MAKRTKATSEEDIDSAEVLSMYSELESLVRVNSVSLSKEDRLSTGLLGLDLILGGGISPAMTTFSGPEQSAKTTAAITIMGANAANNNIKFKVLWDAENSTGSSTDYVANIFETMGNKVDVEDLFGVRKDGNWIKPPLVYYRDDYEADKFFNWLHALQKRLPDKRFDSGRWWYVYERTKENISKFAGKGDKGMGAKNPGIWIPAKDGSLQALIILDSYPSLVPSAMDEEEGSNAMAVQARMFSKHLPRVKGAFRAKRIALLGINQLRLNPGVRYGSPEYEGGGQALQFFSDVRVRLYPRVSGIPYNPKFESGFETEPSVTGEGIDTYRYVLAKAIKNKLSVPNRTSWLRVWVSDSEGNARGYDPVWDSLFYLNQTGQVSGVRKKLVLNLQGLGEAKRAITYEEFKVLILGTKEEWEPIYNKIGYKTIAMRKGLFSQMKKGTAEELYITNRNSKSKANDDEDDD